MRHFPRKPIWKTLRFSLQVKTTEFEVLADALLGELNKSALETHGSTATRNGKAWVDGKIIDFRFARCIVCHSKNLRHRGGTDTGEYTCRKCGHKGSVTL